LHRRDVYAFAQACRGHGMRVLLSAFVLLLTGVSADAQIYHGNDTNTLSVGNELEARQVAAEFCAPGNKYRIIRVHGRHGDEIAINCLAAAPPAPHASVQPGQPATNPITELSAQFRRALTTLSAAVQLERSEGETQPPAQPESPTRQEHDGAVTWNTYGNPW
jgi:hypothetical protein